MPDLSLNVIAYRAVQPNWSFDVLSGEGSKIHGGRFNPPGTNALYLALSPLGALAEFNQAGLSHRPQPTTLCAFEVSVSNILDLSTAEGRSEARITIQEIVCDFRYMKARKEIPPTWKMAEFLIDANKSGIIVPSNAPLASNDMMNLVLWKWGDSSHQVKVIDDHHSLPKNKDSWC
ncbi:MAG: RES domain-containing protein [gamma proteobacterium symbiont of Taylorina sp.]|nr:RES domain-containing protein [gamma proteobacterium symbiont of Taylorina sp.]